MAQPTPTSYWIWFHVFVFGLMAADLIYIRWQRSRHPAAETIHSTAVVATVVWVGAALALSLFVLGTMGGDAATQYLAGYAIEESLSIDNLFVFLVLFRVFRIEAPNQPKVLFLGVTSAIVMRGAFIFAGIGLLKRFEWVSYLFAVILLISSIRLMMPEDEKKAEMPGWLKWIAKLHPVSLRQDRFVVRENGRRRGTVLLLALVAIEATDLVFAIDSIPAVLSITRDPFLAYTSNIMAVMGLRSLYFLVAHLLTKLKYLHYGLAAVLAFAAVKMLVAHWYEISPIISLGVVVAMLGVTVAVSLLAGDRRAKGAAV
ncbi:TerC/Alx family metal homeostasis membrane protein [Edaphobacter aggregans]|uniref:TerC/Alx family metal homeostasis membrane protein n=1 Tax=Edaphobacter aggregans TaxID=570835 RepID=UPI0005584CAB|nr:TerC/Alx family metal homeostasis membrane protein [Edaphobacter aggregans]